MDASITSIGPGDALLVIDVQNDFLPGCSLAARDGDAVTAPLNRVLALFAQHRMPVFATRDWHPPDHGSFMTQGGHWPVHCVAGTNGGEFPAALHLPKSTTVVSKAVTSHSGEESETLLAMGADLVIEPFQDAADRAVELLTGADLEEHIEIPAIETEQPGSVNCADRPRLAIHANPGVSDDQP